MCVLLDKMVWVHSVRAKKTKTHWYTCIIVITQQNIICCNETLALSAENHFNSFIHSFIVGHCVCVFVDNKQNDYFCGKERNSCIAIAHAFVVVHIHAHTRAHTFIWTELVLFIAHDQTLGHFCWRSRHTYTYTDARIPFVCLSVYPTVRTPGQATDRLTDKKQSWI